MPGPTTPTAPPVPAPTGGTGGARLSASRPTVAAWAALVVVAALTLWGTATHDFRDQPIAGDQSAHILQALSIAYDSHTLNFDARDLERWQALGWAEQPVGLFLQRYDDGLYGFAKPYGYSLYLAPFIAVLGPVSGIAIANTLLLALLIGISALLLMTRYRGPVVPLTVGAFFLASYPYMYAYWTHTELFLALLVLVAFAAAVRFAQTQGTPWALIAFAAMGFGLSEKAAYAALFAPIALVMLWKADRWWLRVAMPAVGLAVFAVAVIPYLHYSDGASFTPYGGDDRLYVSSAAPFGPGAAEDGYASTSFEASGLLDDLRGFSAGNTARSLFHTITGRYTGILVYLPVALLLIVAGIARFRHATAWGRAAVVAVLGYLVFYAVVFTANYFGGGHSLGSRYFLQMAPAVLAMAVLIGVGRRTLTTIAVAGGILGIVMLWPHHLDRERAHVNIERTSPLQRLLPVETNQTKLPYVRCDKDDVSHVTTCR